jgi:diguanylate cyclase (GGDEF)-like protein
MFTRAPGPPLLVMRSRACECLSVRLGREIRSTGVRRSMWPNMALIAILLGWAMTCPAATPAPLTALAAIAALDNAHAREALPVDFEAIVVFSRGYENILFVQDGKDAIFVRPPSHASYLQGDRLRIHGKTQNSFRPIVVSDILTLVGHAAPPKPVEATFWDLVSADLDCHMVRARGRVRSADLNGTEGGVIRNARLQLVTDGGHFEVDIDSGDELALKGLLDAEVEVTGAAAGKFDDKMQQTGSVVYAAHLEDLHVLKQASQPPSALPVTPMDHILEGHRVTDTSARVRVHGTITYYEPGFAVVLQNDAKSLWIETHTRENLTIGNQADATGFPAEHDRILTLADGDIDDMHVAGVVKPLSATWEQLAFWSSNSPIGHENDLVSIEGKVVTQVREPSQDEYVLNADGRLFSAILRHPGRNPDGAMILFPAGAKVRMTGICSIQDLNAIVPGGYVPFQILLRSSDDLVMIANPPLISTRNLTILVGVLLLIAVVATLWGWTQERKVHRQADAIAQLEQRRRKILESINHARPLSEILEQITGLISSSLGGVPAWIEIAEGATLGRKPDQAANRRILTQNLAGQGGTTLGSIHAACTPAKIKSVYESQALEMGARLAVLAIETHRLYADLTYRSEFDALTDAHNRFSLDRCLDEQVRKARENASVFGLIYIDLDDFKQVNDLLGHRVGDIYLQESASRMKRQLRPGDMMARLGGDEFAILVPEVRSRQSVEEIAHRLNGCFNLPIRVEDHSLMGSASIGIALYPENGITSDELLNAADAAMYEVKKKKKDALRARVGGAVAQK